MRIPDSLANKSKWTLRRYVRALQRAIREECLRCMNIKTLRATKDCCGLDLENGDCPLYDFRPFRANREV